MHGNMTFTFFKKLLFIVLGLSFLQIAIAQKITNNWLFKSNIGLAFLEDTVLIKTDYSKHNTGAVGIISDANGKLLFYSDGMSVWNKNHTLMPNGTNLFPTANNYLPNKSTIVQKPGSDSIFYIISVGIKTALYFSTVNMNLNNGLGDVVEKGKILLNVETNKLTTVLHENRKDVWLIIHRHNTSEYYAFLITESGVSETSVLSTVGNALYSSGLDQFKASTDGRKIGITYRYAANKDDFTLFDFDHATGILTNPMSINFPFDNSGCDGLEFSSDATKVYVHNSGGGLHQFDATKSTTKEISDSKVLLLSEKYNSLTDLQLGPNGKIYASKGGGGGGTEHLGVIEHPNEYGTNCIVKENGLFLEGGNSFVYSTPVFNQSYLFKTSFSVDKICRGQNTDFQISNMFRLDSARWFFGDGRSTSLLNPTNNYVNSGDYVVCLLAYYPEKIDTIVKTITINPSPEFDLGKDRTVCNYYELSAPSGFKTYAWNTGDSTRTIDIKTSGTYVVTVQNSYDCFLTDSVYLTVAETPNITLSDTILLDGDSISLNAGIFKSYHWSTGETTPNVTLKNEGWYSVTVVNEAGCTAVKSFFLYRVKPWLVDNLNGWTLLSPEPSSKTCKVIVFINRQTGFILNDNQLLKTDDCGTSWRILTQIASGNHLAFKNGIGYVVGNDGTVYKSTFMGGGWVKLVVPFTDDDLNTVSLINEDTVLITGTKTLYRSYNGGLNWSSIPITTKQILHSFFTSTLIGHVGCTDGTIMKTNDGGANWHTTSSVNSIPAEIATLYFCDKNTGFATRGHSTILKTNDGGETWSGISGTSDFINTYFFLDPQNGFIGGEHGVIFKTINGGATFEWLGFQSGRIYGTDIQSLFFLDESTGFAVGNGGRIMKTQNGGKTWTEYAATYKNINQLQFVTNQTAFGQIDNSFIKTTDGGVTWEKLGAPGLNVTTGRFDFVSPEIGYCLAGGSYGTSAAVAKVYKTTDGGITWQKTNKGSDLMSDNLYSIDFIDKDTGYVSGGFNELKTFKTTNGGESWIKLCDMSFSQIQFVSESTGYSKQYNKLCKTVDYGKTWVPVFVCSEYSEYFTELITMHFLNKDVGFLSGNNNMMYKTLDGGITWQKITHPYGTFKNIKFLSPNIGFIASDYCELYTTTNGGSSWNQITVPYNLQSMEMKGRQLFLYGNNGLVLKHSIEVKPVSMYLNAATEITHQSALITGTIASNEGILTNQKIEYGINGYNNVLELTDEALLPQTSRDFSIKLEALKPKSRYQYRLSCTFHDSTFYSETKYFSTISDYELEINNITNITCYEATVFGKLLSRDKVFNVVEFQYGVDTTFQYSISTQPSYFLGNTSTDVSTKLTDLKPSTLYFVRLKAFYDGKTVYSNTATLYTKTEYEIYLTSTRYNNGIVTLSGYVVANKDTITNVSFEYGTTMEYQKSIKATPSTVLKGYSTNVSANVTLLDSTALNYYRLKAELGKEHIYSKEGIFKASSGVLLTPLEIEQLTDSTIQIEFYLNCNGGYLTNIKLRYGLENSAWDSLLLSPSQVFNSRTVRMLALVHGLQLNKRYHFILTAEGMTSNFVSSDFYYTLTSNTDIKSESLVSAYPNPCTDYLYLNAKEPIQRVEVLDAFGRRILIGNETDKINTSTFPSGMYVLKLTIDNKQVIRKIIKQ